MTAITVGGGVYFENCIWPEWDQIFGSAGRAAVALSSHVDNVTLRTYASIEAEYAFRPVANLHGVQLDTNLSSDTVAFRYVHSLSRPLIHPSTRHIKHEKPLNLNAEVALRFGMLESSIKVDANCCVYDPQSAFAPELFEANGSQAKRLAVVGNRGEILAMTGASELDDAANQLIANGAEVVVIKSGPAGAYVFSSSSKTQIQPYRSSRVWKVGSGDVFAAIFAARWGVHGENPEDAALLASRAVAHYVETMALPALTVSKLTQLKLPEAEIHEGKVYLAGPFFNLGQRWLIDEARNALIDLGLDVFSPVHDVGHGPADVVAEADIKALHQCDRVFAILDGLDSGTLFEIGYARSKNIPVYALAQSVEPEALKMVSGSGCKVYEDLVTAMHHTAWLA